MNTLLLSFISMATFYYPKQFSNPPVLYCGMYAPESVPWVALNVELYQQGVVLCGDRVEVLFADGTLLNALALDAGPFTGYYIEGYQELGIGVDIPHPLWPYDSMSAPVLIRVYREPLRIGGPYE